MAVVQSTHTSLTSQLRSVRGFDSYIFFLIVGFAALGFDFVTAAGNAKILNLMSNVTSFVLLIWWGQILYVYGIAMALCIFAGAFFGSRLAIRRGTGFVRLVMLAVTVVLIGKLGLSYFGIM